MIFIKHHCSLLLCDLVMQNLSLAVESLVTEPELGLSLHPQRSQHSFLHEICTKLHLYIFLKKLFIYLFMAVLGLRFCARAFSSCGKWGPLFIAVRGPLTIAASLVVEHKLQTRRRSNCGSRA